MPPVEEWTDQDVYYWVFEVNIGEQHAVALWNAEVNGHMLLFLKKSELNEYCKSLDKDSTQKLWNEIKKLQKNNKPSIFKKGKPSPITRDYPDDFDDDDFSSDEENDTDFNDSGETSLPDLLKARLKEFQEQQQQQQQQSTQEEEGNGTMEEYIVPEGDSVDEPQDEYEEFDTADQQDELYLTPPNEPDQDDAVPPPLPSRMPLGPSTDSNPHIAPSLPPRPGASSSSLPSIPKYQPAAPTIDSEEEEYVVPASQSDPRQPHQQPTEDDFYEPPKNNDNDFGDEYITPNQVPVPHMKPNGRKSPLNLKFGLPKPKPPLPTKSTGKVAEVGKRPPAPLPSTGNSTSKFNSSTGNSTSKFNSSTGNSTSKFNSSSTSNNASKFISSNSSTSTGNVPGFSSLRDRFEKKSPVKPKFGGSLHQIKHELDQLAPPRPMSFIPTHSTPYRPASPKHKPEPVKPAMPKPRPIPQVPKDKSDLSDCDWFREHLGREEATSALQNHRIDGTFVVRPSTRKADFPYTLQLLYKGKIKNLPIGLRLDKKYALGAPKDGETRFDSVRELIEYHRRHDVVLANNEGKTCLLEPVPLP